MAGNLFSISKLKSLINKLLRTAGDIFDGYSVSDAEIEEKEGQISTTYTYTPTIAGNEETLRVVITATNVTEVFASAVDFIKNLSAESIKKDPKQLKVLVGDYTSTENAQALMESISLSAVEARGEGLLGIDLETVDVDNAGIWEEYAFNNLVYNLICNTYDDDIDTGSVKNQKLEDCVGWIHKYIDFLHSVSGDSNRQLSHEEKVNNQQDKENQISSTDKNGAFNLVKGILVRIQGELKKLYQDRLNTELSLDDLNTDEISENNESEESTQSEESENNEGDNMNPNSKYADDADVIESKHISVTLKKIQASDDLEILSLSSNYLPGETLEDIDEIINQEEFLNTLTEEPQAFTVDVDDDGFDIEPCEECSQCNPCESLCEVFKAGIRAYRNLYIIHWMSKGNDMMKLHTMAEEMYGELIQEIDTVGELLVEKQGTVPQLDFSCDYVPVQDYDFQTGLEQIQSLVQMYIDCIDYAYCNQDSDVQSTLDEWLRYWKKQLNYFLERQEN